LSRSCELVMFKVIPRIHGGLGNQLFSYAAARRLALLNSSELVIDHVSGFAYDVIYNRHYQLDHFNIPCRKASAAERLEPFGRIRRSVKRKWSSYLPFEHRCYIQQESNKFDSRLLKYIPRSDVYIEGYWQSENYFKDVEPVIRDELRITPPSDLVNLAIANKMHLIDSVAVHVRFFDDPQESGRNNAPGGYYSRAITAMENLVPNAHYFIFSDQPDAALSRIPLSGDRVTVVTNNRGDQQAYADLWLMTQCKHFIIANSTFSWWGAWLAGNKDKQIIAPGFSKQGGKSGWGFDGLLPDEWLKI
jgi:hypothetical protein